MEPLIGYETRYTIDRQGNVANMRGLVLKKQTNIRGYLYVPLWNGKKKNITIHRLLGIQFLNNPNNYKQIDHIDRNKLNNCLDNLRWCDNQQNASNRGIRCDNKTGMVNIHFSKYENKWMYKKTIKGVSHKKRFNTLEEAIAYKESLVS